MFYQVAITTIDNPFDPFDQFDDWFLYDSMKGYNTCNYLARIVKENESFTEHEKTLEKERAIDEIIRVNPLNIYKKVKRVVESPYEIYKPDEEEHKDLIDTIKV